MSVVSAMHLFSRPISQVTKTPQSPLSMRFRPVCCFCHLGPPPYINQSVILTRQRSILLGVKPSAWLAKNAHLSLLSRLTGGVVRHGPFSWSGHPSKQLLYYAKDQQYYTGFRLVWLLRQYRTLVVFQCVSLSSSEISVIIGEFPLKVSGWASQSGLSTQLSSSEPEVPVQRQPEFLQVSST